MTSVVKLKPLNFNGGGENRTLVLSKLRTDHYMLSVLRYVPPPMQDTPLEADSFLLS